MFQPDPDLTDDLRDPATYPSSSNLDERCDLVMKGGITSGVIYPHAICQLATGRRLQRVGGTSAGAIAAAGAAAAELGRDSQRDDAGFARLAALPENLAAVTGGGHTRLYHLFQPQQSTHALYRVVAVTIGRGGRLSKIVRGVVAALRTALIVPLLAFVAIPALLLAGAIWERSVWGITAAAILALAAIGAAVVYSLIRRAVRDLPRNGFGLCSGMRSPGSDEPALTEWLTDEFDRMAGRELSGRPLTFGDLESHEIELAMFTTDLSAGTQNQLPFRTRIWAFDPSEFRALFPERVVEWMVDHAAQAENTSDRTAFATLRDAGLCPLPDPENMPVIVAVRMSLSFPVLLSTVPLHAIDYTRSPTTIVRHRFSDGGITSNFPIHFFDVAIPGQPTFGINLVGTDALDPDPAKNVSMPDHNRDGILARASSIDTLGGFISALRNSVQNWADSMQTRVPGYRDRIVAVELTHAEGGMNLDMERDTVLELAKRGRYAGMRAERFDFANHRWIRLRSFLQTLEEFVVPAGAAIDAARPAADIPSCREMITGDAPSSYRSPWSAANGTAVADGIVVLASAYRSTEHHDGTSRIADGSPSPRPQLQLRPRP